MYDPNTDFYDNPHDLAKEKRLEKVIQQLESTVLKENPTTTGAISSSKIPSKVRQIVTDSLTTEDSKPITMATPSNTDHLRDENSMLQHELNRVEDLLSTTRAERDEIGIKYNAISERLESSLQDKNVSTNNTPRQDPYSMDDPGSKSLFYQNIELRRRLDEEHNNYKRKLQVYQDGQQKQAQLVQKLQAKVLQYKRRVGDQEEDNVKMRDQVALYKRMTDRYDIRHSLFDDFMLQNTEDRLHTRLLSTEEKLRLVEQGHTVDLETALTKLEEEKQRSGSLMHVNTMIREQLEQATSANQLMAADVKRVTLEWQRSRDELEVKDQEWRQEEQSFNDYFSSEHGRLLTLWRSVVQFRRQFADMKTNAERDLAATKSEVTRVTRNINSACSNLRENSHSNEIKIQVSLEHERGEWSTVENHLKAKVRDLIETNSRMELDKSDHSRKLTELTSISDRLKNQITEKDRTIATLHRTVTTLEARYSPMGGTDAIDNPEIGESQEISAMHEALRRIAQEVITDADKPLFDEEGDSLTMTRGRSRFGESMRTTSTSPLRSPTRNSGRQTSLSPGRKSPIGTGRSRSPGYADSTYSAVQAALNKRQLQVSELRARLEAGREHCDTLRRQHDDIQTSNKLKDDELQTLRELNHSSKRNEQDAMSGMGRIKNALELTRGEKNTLERQKMSLTDTIDSITLENQKLQAANSEVHRQRDIIQDEKDDILKDQQRAYKQATRSREIIELNESKISKLKEEYVNSKEINHRIILDKDVLQQEKSELVEANSKAEIMKAELERVINHLKLNDARQADAIHKMAALNEGLGNDKIELNKIIMQMETDSAKLHTEKQTIEQQKLNFREELLRSEQDKLELNNEKHAMSQSLEMTENTRERLLEEITALNRDKTDVTEHYNEVSRIKSSLTEELLGARRDLERHAEAVLRISKEKEDLVHDKAELTVQVTSCERESRQQSEVIASLKSDKDGLESTLYSSQQLAAQLDTRKEQLEGENQELILKKESLQADVAKTLKEMEMAVQKLERAKENVAMKLLSTEKDLQLSLKQEQQSHEEDCERLIRERDIQRSTMERERDLLIHQNILEKEDLVSNHGAMLDSLQADMVSLQRERDDQLIMAENDKQQVISLLEQEKSTLLDKMSVVITDLDDEKKLGGKNKMEALSRHDSDHSIIVNLQSELKQVCQQFEESISSNEKELCLLNNQVNELIRQKETALKEISELKVQLKLIEETRDTIRRELIDANRRIREGEEYRENMHKSIIDLRRAVNDEIREKETIQTSANDLRVMVKKAESERIDMNRQLQDSAQKNNVITEQKVGLHKEAGELRSSLREVEKSRLETRRELQELRRHLKTIDGEKTKLGQDILEYQSRVTKDEEREEDQRKEIFCCKQKICDNETSREALKKELSTVSRRYAELTDESRMKEKDFMLNLQDSRRIEKKLTDQLNSTENTLELTNAELSDHKLNLSGAEGRIVALESQLARIEGTKRDVEFKLGSIHSSLRRTIGFDPRISMRGRSISPVRPMSPVKGFHNTYSTTTDGKGKPISRTGSPERGVLVADEMDAGGIIGPRTIGSRSNSPIRNASPCRPAEISIADINPESVRVALREYAATFALAERDRDDAFVQTRSLSLQLKDMELERNRLDDKLMRLQRNLVDTEDNKRDIDGRLNSAQTALMLQEETIRRSDRERKQLDDHRSSMERQLSALESDKRQAEERLQKCKMIIAKLEEEKKQLRSALDDAETRITKIEVVRRSTEGELQRVRMSGNEKDTENQVLLDRISTVSQLLKDLEGKCQSQQVTVDRLGSALAKSEEQGFSHKDKLQTLNMSLSDRASVMSEQQERITQLQRALTSSEHDRRVLQERFDSARQSLAETKKKFNDIQEIYQRLQGDHSNLEVKRSDLEGQSRQANMAISQYQNNEQTIQEKLTKVQTEKCSLSERVASLQRTLGEVESEKKDYERNSFRLEKDRSALKKTLDKVEREKMRGEEIMSRTVAERCGLADTMSHLEQENCEQQRQLLMIQTQLAQAEQGHSQRLLEVTARHRQETEIETERLRNSQSQMEKMLEAREKTHRQRVKGLEEQNNTLKEQLTHEMRVRQQSLSRPSHARDPDNNMDMAIYDYETKKLADDVIDYGSRRQRISSRALSSRQTSLGRTTGTSIRRSTVSPLRGARK